MTVTVSGVFASRSQLLDAIGRLKEAGFNRLDAMLPVPDHEIIEALAVRKSLVGYITLAGGLFGMALGFGGAAWTHLLWGLIVGGKPVVSVPPFLIIAFELTILCGGLSTLAGLFLLARLPRLKRATHYDARATEDHYVLLIETPSAQSGKASEIITQSGGDVRP